MCDVDVGCVSSYDVDWWGQQPWRLVPVVTTGIGQLIRKNHDPVCVLCLNSVFVWLVDFGYCGCLFCVRVCVLVVISYGYLVHVS